MKKRPSNYTIKIETPQSILKTYKNQCVFYHITKKVIPVKNVF